MQTTDQELHQQATALARSKGISYPDAAAAIAANLRVDVCFGENAPDGDKRLHRQVLEYTAQNGTSYVVGLDAVASINANAALANRARVAFMQGQSASDEEFAAFAEIERQTRRIPADQALAATRAMAEHSAGAARFFTRAERGDTIADADFHNAASLMVAQDTSDYSKACMHLVNVMTAGSAVAAAATAFSEGHAITDAMLHGAALAHMGNTGASYADAVHFAAEQMPAPVGAVALDAQPGGATGSAGIEIFRAGTHIDMNGAKHLFSIDDVRDMASSYDRSKREAPMVKGHPDTDAPAYGWIASLHATEDGRLMAEPTQWDEGFLADLKAGRFKKRSASFYPPSHASNPAPGKWYLRHLGWLGAQQPALAGLADAAFMGGTTGQVSFTL